MAVSIMTASREEGIASCRFLKNRPPVKKSCWHQPLFILKQSNRKSGNVTAVTYEVDYQFVVFTLLLPLLEGGMLGP